MVMAMATTMSIGLADDEKGKGDDCKGDGDGNEGDGRQRGRG